jgi:hypothetical protein
MFKFWIGLLIAIQSQPILCKSESFMRQFDNVKNVVEGGYLTT